MLENESITPIMEKANMNVKVTRTCMVQPMEPTFNGPMPLTEFDQTGFLTHVPTIYFYRPSQIWLQSKSSIFTTLQTSLAKALVYFYPLAGRMRWLHGSRFEIDCNGSGAQLIEAESDAMLDDLGDFTPSPNFNYLIPKVDYTLPVEEIPFVCMQITKFRCGGVSLGYSISHAVADGQSALHFISEWGRLARGEPLGAAPFLDRRVLRAGEPASAAAASRIVHPEFEPLPVLLDRQRSEEEKEKEKETASAMLKLTETQVEMLKNEANRGRVCGGESSARAYTRYEAIAGHIWRCACRARRLAPEQPTALGICMDVRGRMRPRLPEKFFGNAVFDMFARGRSGELTAQPLGYAAGIIREVVSGVTSEYVNSAIDFVKKMEDLSVFQDIDARKTKEGSFYANPNVGVVSWMSLPVQGMDFGWGKEFCMAPGFHDSDGDSLILPGFDGDRSLIVGMCLQAVYMDDFKKYFYEEI